MARLGSTSCTPIGDCGAPFPPADATAIVDASLTVDDPAEGRYATIQAAIAASRDGDIIAISPGTYDESLVIRRALTIIGACPEEVSIRGRGNDTGISVAGA
ncbi:MAG: hypothetical protein ACNA8P_07515, partial [Phycisphaerales bacterium]